MFDRVENHARGNGSQSFVHGSRSSILATPRKRRSYHELENGMSDEVRAALARQNPKYDATIKLANGAGLISVGFKYKSSICDKTHISVYLDRSVLEDIAVNDKVEVTYSRNDGLRISNHNMIGGNKVRGRSYVTVRAMENGMVKIELDNDWASDLMKDMAYANLNGYEPEVFRTGVGIAMVIRQAGRDRIDTKNGYPVSVRPFQRRCIRDKEDHRYVQIVADKEFMRRFGFFNGSKAILAFKDGMIEVHPFNGAKGKRSVTFQEEGTSVGSIHLRSVIKSDVKTLPVGQISADMVEAIEGGGFRIVSKSESAPVIRERMLDWGNKKKSDDVLDASSTSLFGVPMNELFVKGYQEDKASVVEQDVIDGNVHQSVTEEQHAKVEAAPVQAAGKPDDNKGINYKNSIEIGNVKFSIELNNSSIDAYQKVRKIEELILELS